MVLEEVAALDGDDAIPRGRVARSVPLAALTARTVCGRVMASLRQAAGSAGALERFDARAAQRYAELLGRSRGVLMKVGQILAMCDASEWGGSRFDPYRQALGRVHHAVPAMAPWVVERVLEAELGGSASVFAEFSLEPIATASIGQVHRAVLPDGREVAVKIQYPGVAEAIADDLANVELVVTFMRLVAAATAVQADVGTIAREAAILIGEEVDYRHEAATISAFGRLYAGHPFIRIPQVVPEACSRRILTMSYLDGIGWDEALQADHELRNTWAETILRFAYSNRWLAGLLHADPNPGNYRFFPDGTVGFLDFGCVYAMADHERRAWYAMIRAAVEGRKADLRDLMARAGLLDPDSSLSAEELYQWWAGLLHDIIAEPQPFTYTAAGRARVVQNLADFQDRHNPLTRIKYSGAALFTARIQLNLVNICTDLGATLPTRAISDDTDGLAEPRTALGRAHHAWLVQRGLTPVPKAHWR